MRTFHNLPLPSSLLVLIAAQIDAEQLLQQQQPQQYPTAIRKLPIDDGAKFFPQDVSFAPPSLAARAGLTPQDDTLLAANSSATLSLRPPFAVHRDADDDREQSTLVLESNNNNNRRRWRWRGENGIVDHRDGEGESWTASLHRRAREALSRLQGRDWGCPSGTSSCKDIGHPYSCCHTGETCYKIQDTGLGGVGCCPQGESCSGEITQCGEGDLACPSSLGGGCCIHGFVCQGVGCVRESSSSTSSSSAPSSSPPPETRTTTSTTVLPTQRGSTVVVTVIVTKTPANGLPTTETTTQTTTLPTSSSSSDTDTTTPRQTTTHSTTATTGGVAPVKPTGTAQESYCPTGFYPCLASVGGGCCRTGRDCATTSCPAVASTTIVSDGITIVVPATAAPAASTTATCADGWFLCGAEAGPVAGCCPGGYDCGTASCTTVAAGKTGIRQKELPSSASGRRTGDEMMDVRFGLLCCLMVSGVLLMVI